MKTDFKIPEKFVHEVGVGQFAEIRIDAFKDRIFHATVEAVDSKVDPDSHSLQLRASTANDNNDLMAGLFANVSLIIGERGNTAMVDEAAIMREGTIEFVWVVEKGKARRKAVKTGVREKNMVEIVTGVGQGEIVVTSGHTRLNDGIRVKVVNDKEEIERERLAKEKAEKEKEDTAKLVSAKVADAPKAEDAKVDVAKVETSKDDSAKIESSEATNVKEMPAAKTDQSPTSKDQVTSIAPEPKK